MDRRLALAAVAVAALGAVLGLFVTLPSPRPTAPDAGPAEPAPTVPIVHDDGAEPSPLERVDAEIAESRRRLAIRASWLDEEELANLYLDRERLSGDYHDFVEADAAVTRAFELGRPAGPFLTRARLSFTLHRLAGIDADIDRALGVLFLSDRDRALLLSMRADVAFYRGEYDEALRGYEEVLALGRSVRSVSALAQYRWRTGDLEGARLLLDEAAALADRESPGTRAWVDLVRGLVELDVLRVPEARAALEHGLSLAPGWWQLEEHLAQAELLSGDVDAALSRYEALVDRVAAPEVMDAIAAIHRDEGRAAEFLAWRERARAAHEERIALFPEAAAGHALGHYLELEDDPTRAVELAELNRDARPGGEAQTKLLQAYVRAGRLDEAAEVAAILDASPWSTAESHATLARAFEELGDAARASAEREAAEALAPGAMDRMAWLRRVD